MVVWPNHNKHNIYKQSANVPKILCLTQMFSEENIKIIGVWLKAVFQLHI